MTKNIRFNEIKLAMKAGHYANLNKREDKIYKNAFVNGYKLAKKHLKENKYNLIKIVGYSFSSPQKKTRGTWGDSMTKNTRFNEIKLAMKAGHYANLNTREEKIYKNAFVNGYKLAKKHLKQNEYDLVKIVGYSFSSPQRATIDNIINYICKKYEVSKVELLGKKRTLDIVRSRNIIHNLLNEKYKMNLTNIGRYFKQDHTTVLHSIKMKANKKRYWSKEQTIWQEFQELKEVL